MENALNVAELMLVIVGVMLLAVALTVGAMVAFGLYKGRGRKVNFEAELKKVDEDYPDVTVEGEGYVPIEEILDPEPDFRDPPKDAPAASEAAPAVDLTPESVKNPETTGAAESPADSGERRVLH